MGVFNQGIVTPSQVSSVTPVEIFGIAIDWFAPRTPMLKMFDKIPDGSPTYQMAVGKYRPRTTTLGASVADTSTTSITLADASTFMKGDVLALPSGEYVEITADPNTGTNVITVTRAVAGTTAATQSNGGTVRLVSNTRDGATDNPTAYSSARSSLTQYAQTILHPYAVGGGVQSNTLYPLAPGMKTPLEQYKMEAIQNCMDDAEMAAVYGIAESTSNATNKTAKMGGFKSVLTTNNVTSASDRAAYKATSFQRDLLTAPRKYGGQPDTVFVSSNWMDAFAIWSQPLQLINQIDTTFGRNIKVYAAPFLGDIQIVESSLLPDFTAYSVTSSEIAWRVKRPMIDEPYGKTGDNTKGHILVELSIEIQNQAHHAWLEGVTAFAP